MKYNYSFNGMMWLLAILIFVWLIFVPLFQLGMFTDGVLYASIARNFYLGQGSWWNIFSHEPTGIIFREQPLLVFWIQSFFFNLFGDTVYPERIYSLLFSILTVYVIIKFWQELNYKTQTAWLPFILWLTIYAVRFSTINNVIENTLQFFDLVSVLFLFKAMRNKKLFLNLFIGLLFLFLASMSKGIQGLFPLAVPFLYWISFRNSSMKKIIVLTIYLITAMTGIYFLMIQSSEILESYNAYFASRFPGFPNTPHANTEYRFNLFFELFIELLPPIVLCFAIFIFIKKKLRKIIPVTTKQKRISFFFLLIGLSASLPLMISYEQRFFYLTTSMPYFVFAFAVLVEKQFEQLSIYFQTKFQLIKKISVILLIGIFSGITITFLYAGKITKDKAMITDAFIIGNKIKDEKLIAISAFGWDNWGAHMYFRRYFNIDFVSGANNNQYYIQPKKEGEFISPVYQKINWKTEYYYVYKRK